ncbi:fimbrial biogenesis chaperone [Halomonas halocynthiae]|uniref:fimbrial biogenesis chaperone n=1 Tax=Halomonas halocynthiae TaxID=176290 RepID=UPI0004149242|nr:fimbria/pilus periplasmic chaperone [Halomonas halocynthiae]
MAMVKRTITAVTGLVTALFATVVTASTLLIWPIHPVIESGESATALWVENRGDKPVLTQLRLFDWRQQGGDDQYFPQTDMVVSPPMVEIPAGERQLMRLIRQTPAPPGQERAWRLIIDEVPQAAGSGGGGESVTSSGRH